jgi:hypothetical protein
MADQPKAPEGMEWYYRPGTTEPELRQSEAGTETTDETGTQLKGKLPEDFPGYGALEEAGLTTYAKVRKSLSSLEEVPGIGPATAEKIREAMGESSESEEESE